MNERHSVALALASLALLPVLMFPGVVTGERVFGVGDNRSTHLPHKVLMSVELREGELPVWSRLKACGYPILAESQAGVLYPPHLLLFRVLPVLGAYGLTILLHVALAAWGAFFLLRKLGASVIASTFAAAAYVLHGPYADKLQMSQILEPRSLLPWVFLAAETMAASAGLRSLLAAGLMGSGLAMQVLAGSAQEAYFTTLFASLYVALRNPRRIPGLFVAYATLGLLAAPQFLTSYELITFSTRREGLGGLQRMPAPVAREILFWLLPHVDPSSLTSVPQGFAGLVVPVLAVASVAVLGVRRAVPWLGVAAIGLVFSLGGSTPVWPLILRIPGASYFRYPARNLVFFGLGAIVLAALALDAVKSVFPRWARVALAGTGAAAGLGAFALLVRYASAPPPTALLLPFALAALAAAAAPVLLLRREGRAARGAIALAALLELVAVFRMEDPTVERSRWAEVSSAGRWLAAHPGPWRAHIAPRKRFVPTPQVSGETTPYSTEGDTVEDEIGRGVARAYDPEAAMTTHMMSGIRLSRFMKLVTRLDTHRPSGGGPRSYRGSPAHFGVANVRYLLLRRLVDDPDLKLVTDGTFKLYENLRWLPRAFFVSDAVVVAGTEEEEAAAVTALPDPAHTIVLHAPGLELHSGASGQVEVEEPLRSRVIRMRATCDGPGYLYYAESHYPGWRARVDGHEAPIHRANACFMAIPLPAGDHAVELRFWPTHLTGGLLLSVLGLALLAGLAVAARRSAARVAPGARPSGSPGATPSGTAAA